MIRSCLLAALFVFAFASQGLCQIAVNVGPTNAPVGCDILASVANDTNSNFLIGSIGPITVRNAQNVVVFTIQAFLLVPITVSPGEALVYYRWNQLDSSGNQVPAGNYNVSVTVNFTTTFHPITIAGHGAALTTVGVLRPGTVRKVFLCSPQDPGLTYGCAAALTSNNGIPTCGGIFPLDVDALFSFSTTPNNGVFFNTLGSLGGVNDSFPGTTMAPAIAVPADPSLSGISFQFAFLVVDPASPCVVVRISDATSLTIL